jgi:hypothetical protein
MVLDEACSSRAQFLSRLQQFMDRTLKDLDRASDRKDPDGKEVQAIRNVLLKIARLWKEAVANVCEDGRSIDALTRESEIGSKADNGEG